MHNFGHNEKYNLRSGEDVCDKGCATARSLGNRGYITHILRRRSFKEFRLRCGNAAETTN